MTGDPKDTEKERTLAKTYNSIAVTRGKPRRSESSIKEDGKKQSSRVRPNTHGRVEVLRRREDKVVDLSLQQDLPKSTIEAILLLRSLMEKYRERQRGLHMAFLHLEKAYDSVSRELIWRTLIDKETPRRFEASLVTFSPSAKGVPVVPVEGAPKVLPLFKAEEIASANRSK
ncbi:hypothetical protein Tco_0018489 [Tanacetum coccineum]